MGYCPEGEARITKGYLLPSTYVIHTVGPVFEGGGYGEAELLRSCYTASLQLAAEHGLRLIAFPCIATGAHEFPREAACDISIAAVADWLRQNDLPNEVTFCCYEQEDFEIYEQKIRALSVKE